MSSSISTIVMFVVLIVLMYFMMIKPQKKQQQQHQKMLSELKPGDEITTIGGLHAVVSEIDTEKALVTLDCDGVYLDFSRNAIARVTKKAESKPTAAAEEEKAPETEETTESESK